MNKVILWLTPLVLAVQAIPRKRDLLPMCVHSLLRWGTSAGQEGNLEGMVQPSLIACLAGMKVRKRDNKGV